MVPPWPWNTLQQFAGQRVDLVGIQRTEQRPEAADECVDVERGRRPGQRDRLSRLQFPHRPRPLFEGQITITDEVLVAHRRLGALGERQSLVDGEVDRDGAVLVQGQVLDLADLDTGDADEVPALEARHIREHRAVGGTRVESELPEHRHQNEHEDQAQHGEQRHTRRRCGVFAFSWLSLRAGGGAPAAAGRAVFRRARTPVRRRRCAGVGRQRARRRAAGVPDPRRFRILPW